MTRAIDKLTPEARARLLAQLARTKDGRRVIIPAK
jgi:hypothetical protein